MSANPTPSLDLAKLLAADNVSTADRIWEVSFEAKMPAELITEEDLKCPDCGVVHDPDIEHASDSLRCHHHSWRSGCTAIRGSRS